MSYQPGANGIYIPRFRNIGGDKRDYIRGFGYQGSAGRQGWSRDVAEMNIGGDFKDALSEPGGWTMGITGFGETLPYHDNQITLDKNKKDKVCAVQNTRNDGSRESAICRLTAPHRH